MLAHAILPGCLLCLALLPVCGCSSANDRADAGVSLIVSGDTSGWIMPCGCTTNQSGGLARRAAYVSTLSATRPVVVADVGGAPSGTSAYDVLKFSAILRGEVAMGSQAHNLGAAEVALGAAELKRLADETKAPFISANVRDSKGQPLAPAARLATAGNLRIALVGVLSPSLAPANLQVADPAESVLQALDSLAEKPDAVCVLAYAPLDELQALTRALPEVDIVVGGPTHQAVEPALLGGVMLAAATNKGKFVARFDLAPGLPKRWTGQIVEINATWKDDPRQLANLESFKDALSERDFAASDSSFAPALPNPLPENYQVAGTAACQKCHTDDCGSWANSAHSHAWQTLAEGRAQADSYCQQCHTTGFGLPGGFVSAKRSAERVAVGCESCHGPSLTHAERPQQARTLFAAADQCLRCHDHENSPKFAYDEYWPQIEHGRPANGEQSAAANVPVEERR